MQTLTDDVTSLTTAAAPQRASDAAAAAIVAKAVTEDASMLQEYLVAKSASEVAALPPARAVLTGPRGPGLARQSAATYRAMVKMEASLKAQEKARAEAKARAAAAARAKASAARQGEG